MPILVGFFGIVVIGLAIQYWWLILMAVVAWTAMRAAVRSDSWRHGKARRDIRRTTRATAREMRRVARSYERSGDRL